jgi:hypothetical protein
MAKTIITPEAILSYPHLFAPSKAPNSDKEKYSCVLVFPAGTDLTALKQAAYACGVEKFGQKKVDEMTRRGKFNFTFHDGEDATDKGYPEGSTYMSVRSDSRPGIVSIYPGPDGKPLPIEDETQLYPGARVRASIRPFAYDVAGNVGVSFALNNVQKLGDGTRLDSKKDARDEFPADENAEAADLSALTD